MDEEAKLAVSYYEKIAAINEDHGILLVRHRLSGEIRVKKLLHVYNLQVYKELKAHPVPGTPHIYEFYEENGILTLIEDYISGDTLEDIIERTGGFTVAETAAIGQKLCGILHGLHALTPPVIHRDIKPSNVILLPDGSPVLLDMNAARQADPEKEKDTTLLGTSGYAAPEQYGFSASDARTDIYALGALLKNIVNPKEEAGDRKAFSALSAVIRRAMRMDPADRFTSVEDLSVALTPLTDVPSARKHTLPVILIPAAILIAVSFAILFMIITHSDSLRSHPGGGNPTGLTEGADQTNLTELTAAADDQALAGTDLLPLALVDQGYSMKNAGVKHDIYYAVQIHNPNEDTDILYPVIQVTIRDKTGRILKSDDETLRGVAAGDTIWYGKKFSYEGAKCEDLSIDIRTPGSSYRHSGEQPVVNSSLLKVSGENRVKDPGSEEYRYTGQVTNTCDTDIELAQVCVIFKSDGRPVGGVNDYLRYLPAGKTVSFETLGDDFEAYDSWEVHAMGW